MSRNIQRWRAPLSKIRSYGTFYEELTPQLDYKSMMADLEGLKRNASERRAPVDIDKVFSVYEECRELRRRLLRYQTIRRQMAIEFANNIEPDAIPGAMRDVDDIKSEYEATRVRLRELEAVLGREAMSLPNSTSVHTPRGEENKVIDTFGGSFKSEIASPMDHVELGNKLGILDLEAAARTTGSSFYYLKGRGALLEQALINYSMKEAINAGFTPIITPDIVRSKFIRACGFNPRKSIDKGLPVYRVDVDGEQNEGMPFKVLAATSEIPLAAYHSDQILGGSQLPLKYVAVSHCFRPETGHHGSENRGLYRVHQFTKVELFILKDNSMESSEQSFNEIIELQKRILGNLGFSCRMLEMSSVELGSSAHRKIDIEAFFPVRAGWGELSSASNCTDYQARRLALKYRPNDNVPLQYCHTLNGTAIAVPRVIQAILENGQMANGSVAIPSILHPYMLDHSTIIPSK